MVKYDLYGNGTIADLSPEEFLDMLNIFINLCADSINSYIVNHVSGLGDFGENSDRFEVNSLMNQFQIAAPSIQDKELKELLEKLTKFLIRMIDDDDRIISAYEEVISHTKNSKKPIRNLQNEVRLYLFKKNFPYPPVVQQIGRETKDLISEIENLSAQAHSRINQLRKNDYLGL
ncbi:MAG: hypothetical protein AB9891_12675 [Anaerolineaceae bacterium]